MVNVCITCGALMHCIIYIFKYYFCSLVTNPVIWTSVVHFGSCMSLVHTLFFFIVHHHARRRERRWARYVFVMIYYWLLTMTVQYRWQKPTPLHATASRGGFLPTQNHAPPRLQLWEGWILFFKATNNDDDDEPCRLVVVVCLCLHPQQRQ